MQKPTLAISLDYNEVEIVKGKVWATGQNPNGLAMNYQVVQGEYCGFGNYLPKEKKEVKSWKK
jgi:hypothetical protein